MYISFVQRKKNMIEGSSRAMTSIRDECLVDSRTTNTILKSKRYFSQLSLAETHVNTISDISNLIEGSGRAYILLPEGTKLFINDTLYSNKSRINLLSFKDIRRNGYLIETMTENNIEYLHSIIKRFIMCSMLSWKINN
jgi:hypothetical protein